MTALAIIIRYWREIGLTALVAVIIGLIALDTHHVSQRDDARAAVKSEQLAHAITRQSLEDVIDELGVKNRESEARAQALTDSKADDAKAVADADARYRSTQSRVDALKALARDLPASPACRVPAALSAQLDGL